VIELRHDQLVFRFPEVHEDAALTIDFQRTLRIPDDDRTYPLPPGLGRFPLRHVDDFADKVPERWAEHGGVMLPMYQSEALWLLFSGSGYPCAVRVATGKIDAVTGKELQAGLARRPQNYLVVPGQPWLDGYCVKKGVIRQFVAMPLGAGYTAEEQITGEAEHGGIQLIVHPMKAEKYEAMRKRWSHEGFLTGSGILADMPVMARSSRSVFHIDMGLAPGGRMHQEIFDDPHAFDVWDLETSARCFVHLANSMVWRHVTGREPPTVPPTAKEYSKAGLPWFDFYADGAKVVEGSKVLEKLKSVVQMGKKKGDVPLPENEPVEQPRIVELRRGLGKDEVRVGRF
jgi:hypothetical protein